MELKNATILVAGSVGFIGSNLVMELLRFGSDVLLKLPKGLAACFTSSKPFDSYSSSLITALWK